ncbi:MAG TPA: alpha/beta hydrolase [Ktedonobacterales bacterium]|jgi:pimeloyl-ACP methyl ester carboxylesterase|nr:alpha/beta hydrolase [Ktedonobacterales bacterium]
MSDATSETFDALDTHAIHDTLYRRASPVWRERLRMFRATHTPQSLTVDGQRWGYLAGGQGPRLALLLHGSESDAESLFGAIALLERSYRVLAPTYPADADSIEQVCHGLATLIESTGAPALVIGYSMGGYLAQALAARRPDLVARLALCNTGGPARSALRMVRAQYALFAATPGPLLLSALRAGAAATLWRESPGLSSLDHAFWRAYLAEMTTRLCKRAMLAHGRLTTDFLRSRLDPPTSLAREPGRVLILNAMGDHTIEAEERDLLRILYPAADIRPLSARGHLSFLTQPEPFIAAIERKPTQEASQARGWSVDTEQRADARLRQSMASRSATQ